jgi:hypothetical protein
MELLYSLNSLVNTIVDAVNIEHMTMVWNSSLGENPPSPPKLLQGQQSDSQFILPWLRSGAALPVLPFRHLRLTQLEVSNSLAPPALQHVSITASVDSLPGGYEGSIHLKGDGLPFNLLTFSLEDNGLVSLSGTHMNVPEDPMLHVETSLDTSSVPPVMKGQITLKLHPLIQTFVALSPIPTEYQSVTGTFSGTWTGILHEKPLQTGFVLGPIQGDFALKAHMPTWTPLAQEIRLITQGIFSVDDRALTIVLQPSSSGTVILSLDSVIPPALEPFIRHEDLRTFAWNIRQPVQVVVPNYKNLQAVQIFTGQIQIGMRNVAEQLDILLSPHNLRWEPLNGVAGNVNVMMTTHLKPPSTSFLRLETLALEIDASLLSAADHLAVTLKPSSFFHLSKMDTATLHIPAMNGHFPQGLSGIYNTGQQTWKVQTPTSILSLPTLSLQGQQWDLGEILTKNLAVTSIPGKWAITGESEVTSVHTRLAEIPIPASTWQTRYLADPTW